MTPPVKANSRENLINYLSSNNFLCSPLQEWTSEWYIWNCSVVIDETHIHKIFNVGETDLCSCGQAAETAQHVLQDCRLYSNVRQSIWRERVDMHTKLYWPLPELEKTVAFIIGIWRECRRTRRRRDWWNKNVSNFCCHHPIKNQYQLWLGLHGLWNYLFYYWDNSFIKKNLW